MHLVVLAGDGIGPEITAATLAVLRAASVSTRVVSWNDAAEMNERVCRLALVMPSSTG